MYGINYGQDFPWDKIEENETIYMVDFCLEPFKDMIKLNSKCNFTWIDHHISAIKEYCKEDAVEINGIRRDGTAACVLTWEYFNLPESPSRLYTPEFIYLLGEYDVWRIDDWVMQFQWGMRQFVNTWPDNQEFWEPFFKQEIDIKDICNKGKIILEYENSQNIKFCKAYSFETELTVDYTGATASDDPAYLIKTYKAICCNKGFTNSKVFDSVWDESKYDLMITFVRLKYPKQLWTVSLYSTKPDVDCSQIAKLFGGGGHKGAAGFQCKELPFKY